MPENDLLPFLPPGAADLISQLTADEECNAILRALDRKYFSEPPRGRNSKDVNGNSYPEKLEFPEELRTNQNQLDDLYIESLNKSNKIRMENQREFYKYFRERYEIVSAVTEDGVVEPYFWLSALKADVSVKRRITERDLDVLEYLRDIRYFKTVDPTNNKRWRCKLKFIFDPNNPYFTNTVLTKVFEFSFHNGVHINKAEGTTIYWNKDINLALESLGKKRKWSNERFSFFNFFETKNAPNEEDGDDALENYRDQIEFDYYHFAENIIQEVIPHALTLCRYPGPKRRKADKQMTKIHAFEGRRNEGWIKIWRDKTRDF